MADVPPALHRVNQHCIDSKLLPLPELLTADEQPMFKEFRQLVGAHQRIVVSASFNIGVKRNGSFLTLYIIRRMLRPNLHCLSRLTCSASFGWARQSSRYPVPVAMAFLSPQECMFWFLPRASLLGNASCKTTHR
ncbi:uncharacterized protein LOC142765815 [Rhipicephalus microplus]|uniref:uncharacterized protein LOC142765815 n=1 Tax=Rhipicephalus microplus TaxID=6941 RepID=UPI003F6C7034